MQAAIVASLALAFQAVTAFAPAAGWDAVALVKHACRQAQGKAEQSNPADLRDHVHRSPPLRRPARWKRLADSSAHAPRGRRWSPYGNRRIFCYMAALARGDAERLLRFVAEAESIGGDEPFTPDLLAELGRLVHADDVSYNELDRVRRRRLLLVGRRDDGGHDVELDDETRWRVLLEEHPLCLPAGGALRRGQLSDFLNQRELHRTWVYDNFLAPFHVEYELEVSIPSPLWLHEDVSLRSQRRP